MVRRLNISDSELADYCRSRGICRLSLFGSVLRDDFKAGSDIDVLVQFEPNTGLSLYDFIAIRDELTEKFGRAVDLVDEDGLRNPFRRREILRTRHILYDAA